MKKVLLVVLAFTLFSCADKIDVSSCIVNGEPAGFWKGVWHGAIMFPDFIGSLIWDDVAVYATNNNGAWYDFGFVGGLWLFIKWIKILFRLIRYSLNKE
jgi:hypothetical protein